MLSGLKLSEPTFWDHVRRFDLERRLALILSVLAVAAGIATYVLITGTPGKERWLDVLFGSNQDQFAREVPCSILRLTINE